MLRLAILALIATLSAPLAQADVLKGSSADPLDELNALYGKICKWTDRETIPVSAIDLTHDGVDDYLLTYDLSCRGQNNAFAGTAGMARQIWVSTKGGFVRILDVNARDLRIETRDRTPFVILQHAGGYCMTADAAPCFLTLIFENNALTWASAEHQHPSMQARMRLLEKEKKND